MKTFILFWNPSISSYKLDDFQRELEEISNEYNYMNWSVWEHEKASAGDRFFMVRCGNGKTGICMSGYFSSDPYKDEDWSGKGRVTYYMDLEPDVMIHPEYLPILSTIELINAIPSFDWNGGHSGRLLDEKNAEKLEILWKKFTEKNEGIFIPRTFRQDINPSDLVDLQDNIIYCWLNLTNNGKISVYNHQHKINQNCEDIEQAKQIVFESLRNQVDKGVKIVFKFENINNDHQEIFFHLINQVLVLKIPQYYFELVNSLYEEQELMAILLFCLVKYGDVSHDVLSKQGFPKDVMDAALTLLPIKGEKEEQHLNRIVENEIAKELKKEMLKRELDIFKLDKISTKEVSRLNKALKAWKRLSNDNLT